MRSVSFLAVTVACALALAPARAFSEPSDADRATARALADEGRVALEKRDFRSAEDRFTRADALIHAPTLLLGLARAQAGLGKLVEAQESYQRILREGVKPGSPAVFSKAVEDAARELAPIAARVAWVTLQVSPPIATVWLDGAPLSKAAVGVKRPINPGPHQVRATAPGFLPREDTFLAAESQKINLTLALPAAPRVAGSAPAPAPAPDTTPAQGMPNPDARPLVAGGDKDSAAVGGGPTDFDVDTSHRGSGQKVAATFALVMGGAGLVTGAVAGGLALRKHSELVDACPGGACSPNDQPAIDAFHTLTTISTIGFVVGGVGVTTGIVLFATAPSEPSTRAGSGASVSAYIGPGSAGIQGRFQ